MFPCGKEKYRFLSRFSIWLINRFLKYTNIIFSRWFTLNTFFHFVHKKNTVFLKKWVISSLYTSLTRRAHPKSYTCIAYHRSSQRYGLQDTSRVMWLIHTNTTSDILVSNSLHHIASYTSSIGDHSPMSVSVFDLKKQPYCIFTPK